MYITIIEKFCVGVSYKNKTEPHQSVLILTFNFRMAVIVDYAIEDKPFLYYMLACLFELRFYDPVTTTTPYATSFRRRFFACHKAMRHPHTNIILSLFSIPLVLKCAAKFLKIGSQIKI